MIEFSGPILAHDKYKGAAYLDLPFDIEEQFGKLRVKIKVWFDNKVEYRGSLAKMNGQYFLMLTKLVRSELGKSYGETVSVKLIEDLEPRTVEVPEQLSAALKKNGLTEPFENSSYTRRKEWALAISGAKRPETRLNRLQKIISELSIKPK
jgi:hypothetical protein